MRRLGAVLTGATILMAALGSVIAPNDPARQFRDFVYAPPMRVHVDWHGPFVHPLRLEDRLERRYVETPDRRLALRWFSEGSLVRLAGDQPLLLLGGDSLGRDVFSRIAIGARWSLGVALAAAFGALVIGALVGGMAGFSGGLTDELLMRGADFVLVLPTIYVVLALRALLPLVLPTGTVFVLMVTLLALVGWPVVARGVRAIVATERATEYAAAARALGASRARILMRHLLPAARGFLLVQATLLLPAFVLAEATLSYVGLGFPEPTPSWGAMLREAANVRAMAEFPWLLAPAAAIVTFVLGINLLTRCDAPRHDAWRTATRRSGARIADTPAPARSIDVDRAAA
jgi:peptide/nickel transport system permease protein